MQINARRLFYLPKPGRSFEILVCFFSLFMALITHQISAISVTHQNRLLDQAGAFWIRAHLIRHFTVGIWFFHYSPHFSLRMINLRADWPYL